MVLSPLNSINREVSVKDNAFYFETGQHFAVLLLRQHCHRSRWLLSHNTYRDVAAETQAVTYITETTNWSDIAKKREETVNTKSLEA